MIKQINLWVGILLTWVILGLYYSYLMRFVPIYVEYYHRAGLTFSFPAAFSVSYAKPILWVLFLFNIYLVYRNKKSPVLLRVGLFGETLLLSVFLISLWMPFL